MMKQQVNLSDGYIELREIPLQDAPDLHVMLTDEELCDKAGLIKHTHINQTLDFIYEGMFAVKHGMQYFHGIYHEDQLVGLINFFNVDYLTKSGEYGYFIQEDFKRRGFMTHAVKLLSNFILNETKIQTINVYVDTTNKQSLALVSKLELDKHDSNIEEDMQSRSVEMIRFTITKPFD